MPQIPLPAEAGQTAGRLALLLSLVLAAPGCDTVSDTVDGATCAASGYADSGTVSATVDGTRYSTPCVRVESGAGTVTVGSIDNVVSDQNQRLLTVTAPAETGTYAVGADVAAATFTRRSADDQADQVFAAVSGTVTVTAVSDDAAEGSFSFRAVNTSGAEVEVTAGRFDVEF